MSIYLLIAGSYTPYTLITLKDSRGWLIFGIVWGLSILGIVLECVLPKWAERASLYLYLLMGWSIVIDGHALLANLSCPGLVLLVTGGVVYTLGVIFYVMDRVPYMHTIWHLFVLGGAACQWVSICFCVLS